jgi:hypothetical protein
MLYCRPYQRNVLSFEFTTQILCWYVDSNYILNNYRTCRAPWGVVTHWLRNHILVDSRMLNANQMLCFVKYCRRCLMKFL